MTDTTKKTRGSLVSREKIERSILRVREQNVMLDRDLAELYRVATKNLNRAVTRNIDRFPGDFMFRLTKAEFESLRFHFGTSSWGGARWLPRVFTEQGVAMLSGVLKSERAVQVNIEIMRTFVRLRHILASHSELSRRLDMLEKKYDRRFRVVFEAIRELMSPKMPPKKLIGFRKEKKSRKK